MSKERAKERRSIRVRLTAAVLLVAVLLLCFPAVGYSDTILLTGKKGSDYCTNTYVAGQLQQIFDRLVYSNTPYFTTFGNKSCGNTACTDCSLINVCASHPALAGDSIPASGTAYGSGAFARYAFYTIFGVFPSAINPFGNATADLQTVGRVASTSVAIVGSYDGMTAANLRSAMRKGTPGDIIQTRSTSGANHTMIFLAASDTGVTVLHGIDMQNTGYDLNRVVISEYSYATMISTWNQVITLLRATDAVYAAAWSKGNTHTAHTFTDAGQNFCTVCGVMISPALDTSKAAVFKASKDAVNYKGYYRSTGTAGKSFAAGTYVETLGTVVNSVGVPFYLLADGGYVSGEDFVTDTVRTPRIDMAAGDYPSGVLTYGASFNLKGTVTLYDPGLEYMAGYIIRENGTIASMKRQNVTYPVVYVKDCDINSNLKFSTLEEGKYTYLLTARSKGEKKMSSFASTFEVRSPEPKPSAPTPSAPTLASKNSATVTLRDDGGYEYRREGSTVWQKSATFTGLTPNTSYTFYRRVAETDTYAPSAASAGLVVVTDKRTQTAPSAPTLSSKTTTAVTLYAESGYEYRVNSGAWQKSGTFTGLTPNTAYVFYRRLEGDQYSDPSPSSPGLSVTTDRAMQTAPAAPTLASKTSTEVRLTAQSGLEYRVNSGSWQNSAVFTGLTPNTTYVFYARRAATSDLAASSASPGLTVTTDKGAGKAPVAVKVSSIGATTVELVAVDGFEYRIEGGSWQKSVIFSGLSPATKYKFYQRYAETAQYYAGSSSGALEVTTDRAAQSAPQAPELQTRTDTTVTLKAVSGCEYSRDGGKTWQKSATFTGLISNTSYTFVARLAETSTAYAGAASSALTVQTLRSTPETPAAPELLSVSGKTVTLKTVSGLEYSADGGRTWRKTGTFTFDEYGDKTFVCRVALTERNFASGRSPALNVRVVPTEVTSEKYKVDGNARVISLVSAGVTLGQLSEGFAENGFFTFVGADGSALDSSSLAATGVKLRLPGGEEYVISVCGDVNGDGKINVFDLAIVHAQILEDNLSAERSIAADVDHDGKINVFDYVKIRNAILEGSTL